MTQHQHAELAAKYPNLSDAESAHLASCQECLHDVIDRIARNPGKRIELDASTKKLLKRSRQRFEARHGTSRGSAHSTGAQSNPYAKKVSKEKPLDNAIRHAKAGSR